jgi:hypothetical protein
MDFHSKAFLYSYWIPPRLTYGQLVLDKLYQTLLIRYWINFGNAFPFPGSVKTFVLLICFPSRDNRITKFNIYRSPFSLSFAQQPLSPLVSFHSCIGWTRLDRSFAHDSKALSPLVSTCPLYLITYLLTWFLWGTPEGTCRKGVGKLQSWTFRGNDVRFWRFLIRMEWSTRLWKGLSIIKKSYSDCGARFVCSLGPFMDHWN